MGHAEDCLVYFTERGTGPPLLLVHGLMVTGEMFEPVLEHFAARHRVIVPDLRGHGRSRALPPPYTVARLAEDLSRLLDHLGVERTAVLGYSNGGVVAQQLVLDDPARCTRLVLGCAFAFNMATRREWVEGHLGPLLIRVLGMRGMARLIVWGVADELGTDRARWLAGLIAGQDRALMLAGWRETMAFDSRSRLAEIGCPTLVIAGSKDIGVPMHHARMLRDGVPGARLVVIDGASHALIWTHTEEFLRVTDAFLDDPPRRI
jgi:pimeloyl-ACP methyl ester carboxylesterase